jgi:hypothetical protein
MNDQMREIRERWSRGGYGDLFTLDYVLQEMNDFDSELIAKAPSDIRYLLSEIDRLNKELDSK